MLYFENKGAPEDAFYAYGIVADLISDVTGAGLIRVAGLKDVEKIDHQIHMMKCQNFGTVYCTRNPLFLDLCFNYP